MSGIQRFDNNAGFVKILPKETFNELLKGVESVNSQNIGDLLRKNIDSKAGHSINELLGPKEPTEEQKAARTKLDDKISSTGISYKDAKAAMKEIEDKYKNDKNYYSEFESEQPKDGRQIYIMPYEALDPYKIPEPDKSAYFNAMNSAREIEQNNSALFGQTGLSTTQKVPSPFERNRNILY